MKFETDLLPGDKITVLEETDDGTFIRECIMVKEYAYFIVADFGVYCEGINKAKLRCRVTRLWKGWMKK